MKRILACGAAFLAVACGGPDKPKEPSLLDRYTTACEAKGGYVNAVTSQFWTVEYGCLGPEFTEIMPRIRY